MFDGESSVDICIVDSDMTSVVLSRVSESTEEDFRTLILFLAMTANQNKRCRYAWQQSLGEDFFDSEAFTHLSDAEVVACQKDIEVVMERLPTEECHRP
jgi:hypothetical protein